MIATCKLNRPVYDRDLQTKMFRGKTLLIGDYSSTRIVEQIKVKYCKCYNELSTTEFSTLDQDESSILIYNWPTDCFSNESILSIWLGSSRFPRMDLLIVDRKGSDWHPVVLRQFDHILMFPTIEFSDRLLTNLNKSVIASWRQLQKEQCLWLDNQRSWMSISQVIIPWPATWSPEKHRFFSYHVRERVRLLLLAQSDPQSLISKLDKQCLLYLFQCGAALD